MDRSTRASGRHSTLVAAGILLSRISGLVREKLIGFYLGSSFGVEAFRVALRIPNTLQNLLGEGVLSASFIPVYAKLLADGREEEAGRVAGAVAGLLALVSGALVVVGVVFAEPITSVIAFGFPEDSAKFELTVSLVRILTPGVGFLVLSAWCLGVLNSHRRFFLAYVAPVLWNIAMIAALVAFGLREADERSLTVALAWGSLVGAAAQFLVQLPGVLRLARGLRLSADTSIPGVRRTIRAFGPVVAGRGVVQLSAYLDVAIASLLAAGAIAALSFAQVLYVLPVSLFGMSVAAAELPDLSSMDHDDRVAVIERLERGLARIAFFVVPTIVGFVVIGDEIVGALYQGGEFDPAATRQVWVVLAAYSTGLLASTASRLLQSSLYGVGDTRRPATYAALRVALSTVVGFVLMLQLDRLQIGPTELTRIGPIPTFDLPPPDVRGALDNLLRLGAAGLALGAGAGAWFEYWLLRRAVADRFGRVRLGGTDLRRILVAAAGATVVALLSRVVVGGLHPLIAGPLAVAATGGAYLAVAVRLDLTEATRLLATVRDRLPLP